MDADGTSRRRFLSAAASVAAMGTVAGCSAAPAADTGDDGESGDSTATDTPDVGTPQPVSDEVADRFVDVYRSTVDAVAQIQVVSGGTRGGGTGWVYNDDGHVVTNQHVVAGADDVYARFPNGGWIRASVIATDVYSDIAVLSVDDPPSAATPLDLDEADPDIGSEVVAIGNPFGFSGSVTAGVVSGVDRALQGPSNFSIPDAIQTDAPVNPGNSGGPLVDLDGTVVGVVNSGGGDNVGFAISAALTRRVVPSLIDDGQYGHSYIGIRLRSLGPLLAQANDVERAVGVYVDEVVSTGPSEGVLRGSTGETTVDGVSGVPTGGDVIVALDGSPIPERQALSTHLALETSPGDTIPITVLRDGEERTFELTLGDRPVPT